MHGNGNDFVVLFAQADTPLPSTPRLTQLADRRLGIGYDQLLWVTPSDVAAAAYRIINADGSEVEQCGNGARCVAQAVADRYQLAREFELESPAGRVAVRLDEAAVSVSMGVPALSLEDIPFLPLAGEPDAGPSHSVQLSEGRMPGFPVSMGNPHIVFRVSELAETDVEAIGTQLQAHPQFPARVNVGFLQVFDKQAGQLRVFERGVGETAACGTGACAAMVAGYRAGWFDRQVTLTLPGGPLMVSWRDDSAPVWLTGPAEYAYRGTLDL